ncbi:complement component 1 Q subcomponent-binding protein, mitochondrial [Microcaecilia unicolor]|uniref:Complement component 1 Q subcomponent-binding protein, mitochondrial n=1 Tax=Microcaecilia unicolor TaxID=1415580 RepID=A0A6P7WN91_9AMPH|nr:complement component 1 Q subcomponent-binding protein, mitochondrial [Microcaecilia unicolor]
MLSSFSRTLVSALRFTAPRPLEQLLQPGLSAGSLAAVRPFTRGLWMLSGAGRGSASSSVLRSPFLYCRQSLPTCGCGGLHTEGDKAFSEFLADEIQEEKKIQKDASLPKVSGGWELEIHGTEAKLVKKIAGEKVTVTFNTNNSIPPSFEEESQEGQKGDENEPELVSMPNFVVEVTKQDTKQTLVFDCHYPEDEAGHGEGESDIFSIREVSFQPTGDSEWKETSYNLNTDSLDWALYDHLMDFLADRGVDNTFADELVELSTSLEHQEYIQFLEDLKKFVKCS